MELTVICHLSNVATVWSEIPYITNKIPEELITVRGPREEIIIIIIIIIIDVVVGVVVVVVVVAAVAAALSPTNLYMFYRAALRLLPGYHVAVPPLLNTYLVYVSFILFNHYYFTLPKYLPRSTINALLMEISSCLLSTSSFTLSILQVILDTFLNIWSYSRKNNVR